MTDDCRLSGGQSASSQAGPGVMSADLVGQESSWIGLVSGPALSFVQKYLPGRGLGLTRARAMAAGCPGGGGAEFQIDFLQQLEHVMPLTQHAATHLTDTRCQQDGACGTLEPGHGSAPPWFDTAALRDLGIKDTEELSPHSGVGYLSSVRTLLSHVLTNPGSAQEVLPSSPPGWRGSKGGTWWGCLGGGKDRSHRALAWTEDQTDINQLCPHQPGTEPTHLSLQSEGDESTMRETTGAAEHKEEQADNGGFHTIQNPEGSAPDLSVRSSQSLSPDQDNGYSSLEEEHFLVKTLSNEMQLTEVCAPAMEDELCEETSELRDEEKPHHSANEGQSTENKALSTSLCQNKAIAFIMGCPCSDDEDDSSLSESSEDDDDDDDGFDSERSSDLSQSQSDSEVDSESEHLLNSLSQSLDPYNPRSFSAQLRSGQPRTTTPAASSPTTSPPLASSLSSLDWDDLTSASDSDNVESIRLLSLFSCSSDPYSPFNFQGPIRTKAADKVAPKAKRAPQTPPHSPPKYRKEEAEERLDSGFSELTAPTTTSLCPSAASTKKVRFCDHVEEFFLSCEDRRSPWEQLARDRCRFLRRCQEVEQSISYCLQPQHRWLVYNRLAVQDTMTLHVQLEDVPQTD